MVIIEDDVLSSEELGIVSEIMDPSFPWYSNDHTDFEGDGNPQFTHMFY